MADNIAYSPTHPAVGNVAWQPAGPYATIAYADDGYSVTPMTGYPSVYPHVLHIPPRINAFADLAQTPMYQPDPQVMQWFMQMMSEAMKAMSAPMPRNSGGGGGGAPVQPKSEPKVDIPTVNLNLPEPQFNPSPMGSVVGDAITREPGEYTPQMPAGGGGGGGGAGPTGAVSGNSIIGGPTNLLDIIARSGAASAPTGPANISDAVRDMPWWYPLYHRQVQPPTTIEEATRDMPWWYSIYHNLVR